MENNSMESRIEDLVQLYHLGITYEVIDAFVKKTFGGSNQMSDFSHVKSLDEWKEHFAESRLLNLKKEVIKMVFDYLIKYYREGFVLLTSTKEIAIHKTNVYKFFDSDINEYIILKTLEKYDSLKD